MATRATYQIENTVFYCHWDGYPTGAAQRFANMIAAETVANPKPDGIDAIETRRGGLPFAFIRGNLDAYPTGSHDAHGDTEYRYTLRRDPCGCTVMVESYDFERDIWRPGEAWELSAWLAAMRAELVSNLAAAKARNPGHYKDLDPEAEALEAIPVVVRAIHERDNFSGGIDHTYAVASEAEKIAARFESMAAKFDASNPNKAYRTKQAKEWRDALAIMNAAIHEIA